MVQADDPPPMVTDRMAVSPVGPALGMVHGGRGLYCNMPNGWPDDPDNKERAAAVAAGYPGARGGGGGATITAASRPKSIGVRYTKPSGWGARIVWPPRRALRHRHPDRDARQPRRRPRPAAGNIRRGRAALSIHATPRCALLCMGEGGPYG
jgi:hypothetical protein